MLHANPVHFSVEEPSAIGFSVDEPCEVSFSVDDSSDDPVSFGIEGQLLVAEFDTEPYDGDYTITPSFEPQSFDTTNKRMTQAFTVNPIVVSRTANLAGGNTVFIGGM